MVNACPTVPTISHTISVTSAMAHTTGTNTADTLSAIFCMGALDPPAFSISSIILLNVESAPTFSARSSILPVRLSTAEVTCDPTDASSGMDSPVIADLSRVVEPTVITPSQGTYSPDSTTTVSPTAISSTDTCTGAPSRSTVAVCGRKRNSLSTSERVLPFDFASKNLPSVTSASIIAADSKNRFMASSAPPCTLPDTTSALIRNSVTTP